MSGVVSMRMACKRYGRTVALDHVSWNVPPGVVFALLGENGAGKTTSIRTLLGMERLDSGSSSVLSLSSATQGLEIRRRVGYVPEQPALYESFSVGEMGWFISGFYDNQFLERFQELAREFELPMGRRIRALSKGMRAQVSLALALAHDPEVLLLDEPTSGLDTLVRRRFLESMVDWAAAGKTVLLSSHQIMEVERVADIVAIMKEGRILLCEPLEQLKARLEVWTVSLADGQARPPALDVDVVHMERRGPLYQFLVSHPSPEHLCRWREHPAIRHIEVHVPSLEEIFVFLMKQSGHSTTSDGTVEVQRDLQEHQP